MTYHSINSYDIVVDSLMLLNLFQSNKKEILELLTIESLKVIFLLGIIPSIIIFKIKIKKIARTKAILHFFLTAILLFLLSFVVLKSNSKAFASFFRKHKYIRSYINPIHPVYSFYKLQEKINAHTKKPFTKLGLDATQNQTERNVLFLVIGETARGDRFSINGYERETNPLISNEKILTFSNVTSCGTSTAHSVPCIFSSKSSESFELNEFRNESNLLDIIAAIPNTLVVWRDNNSDSKGVAERITYQDFKDPKINKVCMDECRDIGMLEGLNDFIEKDNYKNIVIVFHMMGSHGPSYFKRYPKEFEKFTPVCKTGQLEECSIEEINNVYDNTILYTDYFLSESIKFLKSYENTMNTSLIYVSDHGESLGENGYYLHGYPYRFAPKEQKAAALIFWPGQKLRNQLGLQDNFKLEDYPISHDDVFHSVLGVLGIETQLYSQVLDFAKRYRVPIRKKN